MSDLLTDIIGQKDKAVTDMQVGLPNPTTHSIAGINHVSDTPTASVTDANSIRQANFFDTSEDGTVGFDVDELDEDNPALFKYDHYFAQAGNKKGFIYQYMRNGEPTLIHFETGTYVTRDVELIKQLRKDIKRPSGISFHVSEITKQYYRELVASNKKLQAITGAAGSEIGDPLALERKRHSEALTKENEQLRKEIAAIRQGERDKVADAAKKAKAIPAKVGA